MHERRTHRWPQKLLAEFAGTFAAIFVAAGAAGTAAFLRGPINGPGLPEAYARLVTAVAYGVAYGAAIVAIGHLASGLFNPAVTVGHWVTHRFGTFEALCHVVAQLAGAGAAAYALRFAWLATTTANIALLGPPMPAGGVTRAPALLIEAAMSFVLMLALWATIVGRARPRYWLGGIVAGVVVAAASYLGAPYTGGVLNPARAFGPALAARQWAYQGVYWVGPLAGAVAAASLYDLLFRRRPHEDAALKGGATQASSQQ